MGIETEDAFCDFEAFTTYFDYNHFWNVAVFNHGIRSEGLGVELNWSRSRICGYDEEESGNERNLKRIAVSPKTTSLVEKRKVAT